MVRLHENVSYFGFSKNLRLENGEAELVIPTEFGPRIMRYALVGRQNVFAEISPQAQRLSTSFGDDWHIYGGHRLWYAPEAWEGSYYPDNRPVRYEPLGTGVRLRQEVEPHSGLEKTLEVELAERGSHVTVRHQLSNRGAHVKELAPWALSAMAPGGRAIFPQPQFVPHPEGLAPSRPLVLWPFTRMNDSRWTWGDRFLYLRQDRERTEPQKVGMYDPLGYMAYELNEQLFLKRHTPRRGAHADFGCNVETFTNELFLELETLAPLAVLAPGQTIEHVEHWSLFDGVALGAGEAEHADLLARLVAAAERESPRDLDVDVRPIR